MKRITIEQICEVGKCLNISNEDVVARAIESLYLVTVERQFNIGKEKLQ